MVTATIGLLMPCLLSERHRHPEPVRHDADSFDRALRHGDAVGAAIRLDPTFPNSYYSLAIAFAESGLYRDAARSWRKCADLAGAPGPNADSATAERALENAKLMDEIIADADKELAERAKKVKELESGASTTPAPPAAGAKPKS